MKIIKVRFVADATVGKVSPEDVKKIRSLKNTLIKIMNSKSPNLSEALKIIKQLKSLGYTFSM